MRNSTSNSVQASTAQRKNTSGVQSSNISNSASRIAALPIVKPPAVITPVVVMVVGTHLLTLEVILIK